MKNTKISSTLDEKTLFSFIKKQKNPVSIKNINEYFAIDRSQRRTIKHLLRNLIRKGSISGHKGRMFTIAGDNELVKGTLWCTRNGNGFVIPDKEGIKDIFIPVRSMKNALQGDKVTVRMEPAFRGRREGKIVDTVKRNINIIVGYIDIINNKHYIIPEDERINYNFNIKNGSNKEKRAKGAFVAARITRFPDNGEKPECEIVKTFKNGLDSVNAVTDFIEYKYGLPGSFKRSTESEAKRLSTTTADTKRVDFRNLRHITIDGELAKDFDDAVCIHKKKDGYILLVSIADVCSYVTTGSQIDIEARRRGTSVYFPGKVLPMLPKSLSNDLCSINPSEDKLALTVELEYDNRGNFIKNSFYSSIIRSSRRFTYKEVEKIITGQHKEIPHVFEDQISDLEHMANLASLLKKKREERGSLDFDLPEPEVILDIEGGVQNIIRSERLFSHRIIEEFMISANEAVARFLRDKKAPAIYRIHEEPDKEKLREMEKLLHTLPGKKTKRSGGHFLQSILQSVRETDYEFFVNRVILRLMKQARYSAVNKGHFGLASDCYLHFTSPIRRYPDLVCHRSLKETLTNAPPLKEDYEKMAADLSERERTAMEAERDLEDRIRILFMKDKLGRVYNGIISHVTAYGFFVELMEIFVEGLVLITDLSDDYYRFEEERFRLIGRRRKKTYRIGDKIQIKIITADVETKKLIFIPL